MSEKEIQQTIDKEYDDFLYSRYDGKLEVPKDFIVLFKKGVMAMPPFAHKISPHKIKAIVTTPIKELTFDQLSAIIKILLSTSPDKFYSEFDVAIQGWIKMEKFVLEFNGIVDGFTNSLKKRKENLMNLTAGLNKNSKIVALA